MAKRKNKSKKDKKKNDKKGNNGNDEQPKRKANLPLIESSDDLDKMSLDELVKLSLSDMHQTEIVELCAQYTRLDLYGGEKLLEKYKPKMEPNTAILAIKDADVTNDKKKEAYCKVVPSMFFKIESLIIVYHPRMNDLLPQLLKIWNEYKVLTHIHIIGGSNTEESNTQFWKALRFFKSLTRLDWRDPTNIPPAINNQTEMLGQIEYIRIDGYNEDIVPLFRQFGDKLKGLRIDKVKKVVNFIKLNQVFKQVLKSCVNLENINLDANFDDSENILSLFADRCKQLREINLCLNCSISFLLTQLTKLSNIAQINIGVPLSEFTEEVATKFEPFHKMEIVSASVLIHPIMGYTVEQFNKTFGLLFPNLKVINIGCFEPQFATALKAAAKTLFPKLIKLNINAVNQQVIKAKVETKGCKFNLNDQDRVDIARVDEYGFHYNTDDETDEEGDGDGEAETNEEVDEKEDKK